MKVVKWLDDNLELVIMGIALVTITVVVTLDILLRNVTGSGLVFAQELSQKCEIVLAAMGISYGVVSGKHIKVDIIQTFIPATKKILNFIGDLSTFLFCVILAYYGTSKLRGTLKSGAVTAVLQIPMFYIYLSMELGLIMGAIRVAEKYIKMYVKKSPDKE